jgi:hypothetical protein
MTRHESPASTGDQELERIISRMQRIQRNIKASRQPASMLELEELKSLGREYARIVERLANPTGSTTND